MLENIYSSAIYYNHQPTNAAMFLNRYSRVLFRLPFSERAEINQLISNNSRGVIIHNCRDSQRAILAGIVRLLLVFLVFVFAQISSFASQPDIISHYYNARLKHLTINDGLSQSFVSSIHQDHLGFIWIGTKYGINMYDGYSFTIFKYDPFDSTSISDNFIKAIYSDSKGRLWVGTLSGGLNLFDRQNGRFIRFFHDPNDENSISNNNVQAIIEDKTGNIWIGTSGGGVNRLSFSGTESLPDQSNTTVTRFNDTISGFSMTNSEVRSLLIDRRDVLWVGTTQNVLSAQLSDGNPVFRKVPIKLHSDTSKPVVLQAGGRIIFEDRNEAIWMGNAFGLFQYQHDKKSLTEHQFGDSHISLKELFTATAFQNKETEELWISRNEELTIINTITGKYTTLVHNKNQSGSLQKGLIISLFVDQSEAMWIGTNGYGISVFDPYAVKFNYPDEKFIDKQGVPFSTRDLSIRAFYETTGDDNYLWLGANTGLFSINLTTSELKAIELADSLIDGSLFIYSIQGDGKGFLWLGTSLGLIRYNPLNQSYGIFPTGLVGPDQTREPRVAKVFANGEDIWAITPNTIAFFNQAIEEFEHVRYNNEPLQEHSEAVFPGVLIGESGNLWVGTKNGLHYFDIRSRQLVSYANDPADTNSLSFNDVRAIVADHGEPGKYLWLATAGGGLSRFDLINKIFKSYTEQHGLSNNMVNGILCDEKGNLWASTNKGLSKFNLHDKTFTNYTVTDGLQSNEFNGGAFYRSRRGEMFFGGIKGYNNFYPSQVYAKQFLAPVVITAFNLLTEPDKAERIRSITNISETNKIYLKHNQNHFLIEFASLDFASPERNHFSYSLTTSGERWIYTGTNRSITITDMKPGSYTLKIRGTNNDGIWSDKMAVLQIHLAQPWWKQTWAFFIYLLMFIAAFAGLRQYELSRVYLKTRIRIADLVASKLKEIDLLKSQFYANISHEFRTPLTLIKGPVEQMLEENTDLAKQKMLKTLHSNTERLLDLINQLLDLSKLESGQYEVKASAGDIAAMMKGLVMSFASLTEQKQITLRFIEAASLKDNRLKENFYFDWDIMQKIMTNLLSNAVKFTPEKGKITVSACLCQMRNNKEVFEITIKDTGIGIPKDKLPFIYDRFYQVDASPKREHEGAGIGLAFVKELMVVHKGKIAVMSKPGKGTTFRVRIPLGTSHFTSDQIVPVQEQTITLQSKDVKTLVGDLVDDPEQALENQTKGKDLVLVVEDHADVRNYICDGLKNNYRLLEASTGIEGLEKAEEFIPDLIISDVMMPLMDGFEFCEKIKTDLKTSHIPVILLTARSSGTDRIQGLETGADDYLTKPFNTKELLVRVKNLIHSRHVLREKFQSNTIIKPGEISVSSRDRVFMEKLLKIMESNIGNEHFSVDELSKEIGMSSSQLHRKLKALVNQSVGYFIRSVRMNRAKELLEKDAGNIADIAYMVGYADPGYFSKTYRAFFGILPSGVQKDVNI